MNKWFYIGFVLLIIAVIDTQAQNSIKLVAKYKEEDKVYIRFYSGK